MNFLLLFFTSWYHFVSWLIIFNKSKMKRPVRRIFFHPIIFLNQSFFFQMDFYLSAHLVLQVTNRFAFLKSCIHLQSYIQYWLDQIESISEPHNIICSMQTNVRWVFPVILDGQRMFGIKVLKKHVEVSFVYLQWASGRMADMNVIYIFGGVRCVFYVLTGVRLWVTVDSITNKQPLSRKLHLIYILSEGKTITLKEWNAIK